MAEPRIPLGKGKSVLVTEAEDDTLQRFVAWYESDPQGENQGKYRPTVEAARAELGARRQPTSDAVEQAQEVVAIERAQATMALTHDPAMISKRFDELRQAYHLVAPATHVDALPEGFGVSISFVYVDANSQKGGPGDVYPTGSGENAKVGLSGHVIQQIGAAAAIDWDPRLSGRLDDGSDPHYVHYRAVGYAKNFDGTPRMIQGECEMDLREGSPQYDEIRSKAESRRKRFPEQYNDGGDSQILEMRKFILRHAETKAQSRAICRGLGVKRAYHAKELKKPFAVARLSFTGHTEDRELARDFARMNATAALHGSRQLYGAPPPAALPAAPVGHAPPPIAAHGDLEDGFDFDAPDPDPSNGEEIPDPPYQQPGSGD